MFVIHPPIPGDEIEWTNQRRIQEKPDDIWVQRTVHKVTEHGFDCGGTFGCKLYNYFPFMDPNIPRELSWRYQIPFVGEEIQELKEISGKPPTIRRVSRVFEGWFWVEEHQWAFLGHTKHILWRNIPPEDIKDPEVGDKIDVFVRDRKENKMCWVPTKAIQGKTEVEADLCNIPDAYRTKIEPTCWLHKPKYGRCVHQGWRYTK